MHTSTRLVSTDFHFLQHAPSGEQPVAVAAFCPDYHPQDRVGVVSPSLEQGVLHTSYALLALTTVFYDHMRAQKSEFFDYPQHFAFVGTSGINGVAYGNGEQRNGESDAMSMSASDSVMGNVSMGNVSMSNISMGDSTPDNTPNRELSGGVLVGDLQLAAETPQLWNAWSWLDVWPDAKWVTVPASATNMLKSVFDYQINRLFWPRDLTPALFQAEDPASKLPAYLWKMLKTSLKSVYLYGELGEENKDGVDPWAVLGGERIEIRGANAAQEIVQESLVQLPAPLLMTSTLDTTKATHAPQIFTSVDAQAFLATLQGR